jgi:hypothetical protein
MCGRMRDALLGLLRTLKRGFVKPVGQPGIRARHTRALHPNRYQRPPQDRPSLGCQKLRVGSRFPNYLFGPMSAGAFLFWCRFPQPCATTPAAKLEGRQVAPTALGHRGNLCGGDRPAPRDRSTGSRDDDRESRGISTEAQLRQKPAVAAS